MSAPVPPTPWHCPICERVLQHPRLLDVGCVDTTKLPMGECPMHRTVPPREVTQPSGASHA